MEAASRNHLARFLAARGDLEEAESQAQAAVDACASIPGMRGTSLGVLADVLFARGRHQEALARAEEGMKILAELGTIDQGEARLRLVHARALHAAGRQGEAREAIERARERIQSMAAKIKERAWTRSFLENVPENALTLRLAAEWST
jgi:hypothetical protein